MDAVQKGYVQMREVKCNKNELLVKIKANREKHVAEYDEAVTEYKLQAIEEIERGVNRLKQQVSELKAGEKLSLTAVMFNLKVPENHEKDYNQVITMLEMSVEDVLTIRSDEFACYVMDDWNWKRDWELTKSLYSNKTRG